MAGFAYFKNYIYAYTEKIRKHVSIWKEKKYNEVCNRAVTYEPALARKSGELILAFWLEL